MSEFWSIYIIVIVAVNILGCTALLYFTRNKAQTGSDTETTGHVYDGIEEYDNPLPRWWLIMFYITIVFSVIYLLLYPGLGNFKGTLGWTQVAQYDTEVSRADEKFMPLFRHYAGQSIEQLRNQPDALEMGQSIFTNVCFGCHGADGRGALGFPNLTDDDWLYGGSPEQIKVSIEQGRMGIMPGWQQVLGNDGVNEVVQYVLSKNSANRDFDATLAVAGESRYQQVCLACHGSDLKGNQALGAPNLTDGIWLHGGSVGLITDIVANGVQGNMPPHASILGPEKAHLVAAYVYSLSTEPGEALPATSTPAISEPEETTSEPVASDDPLAAYAGQDLETLMQDSVAMELAQKEYNTACVTCHGADGKGLPTFPDLTDDDWQYGGSADQVLASVLNGRNGIMPPWQAVLGDEGVTQVTHYVLSKNQQPMNFDAALASAGEAGYTQVCVACHGVDLSGNQLLGAPNLTDAIWRHGNTVADLERVISQGLQGVMPAHKDLIGETRARLAAAYAYSLSKHNNNE
ncbi:cytochrome-c oxidase, cbb3-type subunit III [Marinicella sp. W31]|uniref:cytochrome-c oxidase, cbb3-type subunit III n=1 Tax=Marinicella sp. W31 TaxID=3023713 RepID=UPI003758258F